MKYMNKKYKVCGSIFGVVLSLAIVYGHQLEKYDYLILSDMKSIALFLLLSICFSLLAMYGWMLIDKCKNDNSKLGKAVLVKEKLVKEASVKENMTLPDAFVGFKFYKSKSFYKVFFTLSILTFTVLLGVYPGFFVYDASTELAEVEMGIYTTHHPLLHVLLLGYIIKIGYKLTGSYNIGIFLYIFCQMLVINAIFSYTICYIHSFFKSRKYMIFMILFYGAFPTVVMYTLCSSKDGLFSAFLLLTIVLMMQDKKSFVIAASLMMLFRNNGFYAYLVFAIICIIYIFRKYVLYTKNISKTKDDYKKTRYEEFGIIYNEKLMDSECDDYGHSKVINKKTTGMRIILVFLPIIIYMLVNSTLIYATNADSSEKSEMLTVPIQQLARVYNSSKDAMSDEDKEILYKYISEEGLKHYTPRLSDITKSYFDNDYYNENSADFWKLYFKYLKKYPLAYLNAWLLTSYGYYYPFAVINVYGGNTVYTFTYTDSSYFGYETELPGVRDSFIPVIDKIYRYLSIEKFQQNIPVIALFFAPAFYFFLNAYMLIYLAINRKKVYPFALVLLVWLTVLLGPTYLVRYVIVLWYICPYVLAITFAKVKNGYNFIVQGE